MANHKGANTGRQNMNLNFEIKQKLKTDHDKRDRTGRMNTNYKIKQEMKTQTMTIIVTVSTY